jgi:hypothetical protein
MAMTFSALSGVTKRIVHLDQTRVTSLLSRWS